jgi:hypothetical protein
MVKASLFIKDPVFEDYLRWLFSSHSGEIIIRTKFDLGNFIVSHVSESQLPKQSFGSPQIQLQLPISHFEQKKPRFYFFDEWQTEMINKQISACFDLDYRQFCVSGDEKGIKKHIVIQSFIRVLNIRNSPEIFERLKKRDYRRRKILDQYLTEGIRLSQSINFD